MCLMAMNFKNGRKKTSLIKKLDMQQLSNNKKKQIIIKLKINKC